MRELWRTIALAPAEESHKMHDRAAAVCPWRIELAPRFSISKGASSFFSRAPGQSFFSQKGLAPGPFFFLWRGRAQVFFGQNHTQIHKIFQACGPQAGPQAGNFLKSHPSGEFELEINGKLTKVSRGWRSTYVVLRGGVALCLFLYIEN